MNRGASATNSRPSAPSQISRQATNSVLWVERSGSRRCRQATSHSNPRVRTAWAALSLRALRAHEREQDDVADRRLIAEQHRQPIDADAFAGGGRQPVLQRAAVVLVVVHRLLAALRLGVDLAREARALIGRVIQ